MNIQTKYSLGQKVVIIDLENLPAVIHAIRISANATTYLVGRFSNGEHQEEFLFEEELAPRS